MNKKRFRAEMALHGDTGDTVGKALGISKQSVSGKLNERQQFTQSEILILKKRWNLSAEQVDSIFFATELSCQD